MMRTAFDPLRADWSAHGPAMVNGPAVLVDCCAHIPTSLGDMSITLHAFGARLKLGPARAIDYGLLVAPPKPETIVVEESAEHITVASAEFKFTVEKSSLAFELRKGDAVVIRSAKDGHFARRYRLPPFAKSDHAIDGRRADGWIVNFDLTSTEYVFGLGEKWGPLNKRGQLIHSFNYDALGVNAEASYKNAPFAWSPRGWGLFCHTPAPVLHSVGFSSWSQRAYGLFVEDASLDLFLFSGSDGAAMLHAYTGLTGRAPAPPGWSLGAIMSKAYYRDADEILATAREIRQRGMPCDTITFDGRAWQDTKTRFSFDWDPSRYGDPASVLRALKDLHFRVCVWEYPLVSVHNPLFDEMAKKGWLLRDAETGAAYRFEWEAEPFGAVLTPLPTSGIVDFTHPDAYAYWRDRHKALFDMGVDMIKADFGEQVPDNVVAHNGESGRALHNIYAYLYNKCVYEAAETYNDSGAFLFSRAAWTGAQRFPAQWGGDPQADWEGLSASIRGGLSWGATGAPFYATDIGGFYGDERDPILYVRWLQAGVFSAHLRLHGIGPREPWSYGPEAEAAAMEALRLRYRLLPYIEKTIAQSCATGLPVQRMMAIACPDERESWSFDDQFFFGDDLLVAPCYDPSGAVEVYLPSGQWRRFLADNGALLEGGRVHRLTLSLTDMAVFVRDGVHIPLGDDIEYIN